jgi:hypothetical protein
MRLRVWCRSGAAALSFIDREKQSAVVMQDLLAVERDESALVWLAMAQGLPMFHRRDCASQAILQCRLVTAPRVEPSPPPRPGKSLPASSPGMSWLRR